MTAIDPNDVEFEETLEGIGNHWGLVLVLGIASLLVGIVAVVWPGKTVLVVAVLLAIWLIVTGVFQIIRGFGRGLSGGLRALLFISGGLSLILGIIAFGSMFQAAEILAIFVGIAFLFQGFGLLFFGAERKEGRGWNIFGGIVLLLGGFAVLVWPAITLIALTWVVGIWLIVAGIMEIFAAFGLRSASKKA